MTTATPKMTLCLLAILAAMVTEAVAAAAGDGTTTTHLHFYIHETGSSAESQYLGRAEGLLVQADLGNLAALWTMLTLAFSLGLSDDGDYKGSTLVLDGRVDFGGGGAAERAVVGGTGRFRRARGYSLMTKFGNPTPSTGVFEMDTATLIVLN
ncbi:hypothetical protein DAI22_03g208300 [Oryza sativa Japonica Group]|nr:hypothetical protein DAI22_03g208300 [Oryza sativa Japonica Group]